MSALHALEDRLRAVEDTLAIYHLIASHPPAADTGTDSYYRDAFTDGGEVDPGGAKGARGKAAIAAIVKTPDTRRRLREVFAISPACRVSKSTATPRWRLLTCRSSRRTAGRAARSFRPWQHERFPYPSRGRQPLGAQARQGRLESDTAHAASARRH
ncbi:MAG: nuclear transport factor 2 family protein [Sphingobacteriales bacterium]|jgi:hypothetical protein